jgi:predicted nucleotidyltransferase
MASRIQLAYDRGLITPPKWLPKNTHYEVITGSVAYGASGDTSDMDIAGFCIPPKSDIFPHLRGEVFGFGRQIQRFEQYQQHHVDDPEHRKQYDFTIFSIVKFFQLCMENNPNMLDLLFTPQRCVLHCSKIGQIVRDNRKMFLSKECFPKFRGYMHAQLSKISQKTNSTNPKRADLIAKYGYDTKFASHVVRLGLECEQILEEGDLELDRNSEILKAIRRGEWSYDHIIHWAQNKETVLDTARAKSTLPLKPDEAAIKAVLMQCIEEHYGSISEKLVVSETSEKSLLHDLEQLITKYR